MRNASLEIFGKAYPQDPAAFALAVDDDLLQQSRLVTLSGTLPDHLVEYNRGDLPVAVNPDDVPAATLPAAEVINQIGTCNSWMVLRNVERDNDYAAFVDSIIDHVRPVVETSTGPVVRREAFIFVSSPGAVTPLHMDEEHNILIQVKGAKTVTVFAADDRDLVSQTDLERFHAGGHRNLDLKPGCETGGTSFALNPGDALYIPPLAPHWVKVNDEGPSTSLSVTWRSRQTLRTLYLHQINHERRQRGQQPRFPGKAPIADQLKIWRQSAQVRLEKLVGGRRD